MQSPVARATSVEENSSVVRCRPDLGLWLLVVLIAPLGVAMITAPFWGVSPSTNPASDAALTWVFCGIGLIVFLLLAGVLAWWLLCAKIVADEEMLCWRHLGRWRCARWNQIIDFYDCPTTNRKGKKARVETCAGRLVLLGDSWKNTLLLRDAIQERATAATVRHWALKGAREADAWPRRFDYDTFENKSTGWMLALTPLFIIGLMTWQIIEKIQRNGRTDWPIAVIFFVLNTIMLLLLMGPAFLVHQTTRRRRTQQIIATPDELQFHDGDVSRVLKWDEITNYYSVREGFLHFVPRFVVESRRAQIDFAPTIKERAVLQEIIRHHARNVGAKEWAARDDDEVLGGQAERWSGGALGVGKRIYHYRTRTNRAVLWLPSALFVIFLLLPFFAAERPASQTIVMAILAGVLSFWGWWRFYCAAVLVNDTAITHRGALGEREIEWNAVREYSLVGGDVLQFIELKSDAKRLRFWYGVADLEELKSEITRRAVNSTTREWNEL